jgi:hypothetical protein
MARSVTLLGVLVSTPILAILGQMGVDSDDDAIVEATIRCGTWVVATVWLVWVALGALSGVVLARLHGAEGDSPNHKEPEQDSQWR